MEIIVAIYLRSDIDWASLSREKNLDREALGQSGIRMSDERIQRLQEYILLWSQTFSMSYFEYRQELNDIATLNHARIQNVDFIIRNHQQFKLLAKQRHVLLLPINEEDWLAPNIVHLLRPLVESSIQAAGWSMLGYCPARKESSLDVSRIGQHSAKSIEDDQGTNEFALLSDIFERYTPECQRRLLHHPEMVLATLKDGAPDVQHQHISVPLGITHRFSLLQPRFEPSDSPDTLLARVRDLSNVSEELQPDLFWADDSIRAVETLYGRLLKSARLRVEPISDSNSLQLAFTQKSKHTQVINAIIEYFGFRTYLEIGCGANKNFDAIVASSKIGVDPEQSGTLRMTSDDFFEVNHQTFDCVFVDGLHLAEQVIRDVQNSLRFLSPGGCILIHDCLPAKEVHQNRERTTVAWNGDVWKAAVELRTRPDLDMAVLNGCQGLAALFVRPNTDLLTELPELCWSTYLAEKERLLRIMNFESFSRFVTG